MNVNKNKNEEDNDRDKPKPQHLSVATVTTSGSFPSEGFDSVPAHQKVRIHLEHAVRTLKIADTANWIAVVNNKEINLEANYIDNGLSGQVTIDYGPREGGGGCE